MKFCAYLVESSYHHHLEWNSETINSLFAKPRCFAFTFNLTKKHLGGKKTGVQPLPFLSTKPGCTTVPWHRFVSSTTYRLGRWYSTRNLGGADGRGGHLPHGDLSESSAGRFWDIEMREIYEKQIEKSMKNKWMKSTFLIVFNNDMTCPIQNWAFEAARKMIKKTASRCALVHGRVYLPKIGLRYLPVILLALFWQAFLGRVPKNMNRKEAHAETCARNIMWSQ